MTKSIHAFVLHKYWSGDTSARVYFFTRELGVIHCLCKGGRSQKKQSLLQAFTPLWLAVDERYDRHFVRNIESTQPMLSLLGTALFSGLYLNELLYYVLKPEHPDPVLFDAYYSSLKSLAQAAHQKEIESILRRFEWTLIDACGYSFSWTEEASGGGIINPESAYRFVAGEGFVQKSVGIPGSHILALAEDNLEEAEFLKSAKIIMRQAIDHLLSGREIKARGLFGR